MSQQEQFFNEYQDDSMEMSDREDGEPGPIAESPPNKKKKSMSNNEDLQNENDALKCQVEAYKNEIDMARKEASNSLEEKDKQMKALQYALKGVQQRLVALQSSNNSEKPSSEKLSPFADSTNLEKRLEEKDDEIKVLRLALQGIEQTEWSTRSTSEETPLKHKANTPSHPDSQSVIHLEGPSTSFPSIPNATPTPTLSSRSNMLSSNDIVMTEHQLKLIGLISCFLNVHPMGASPDYIWSYLKQMQIPVRTSEIEELLERMPSLFKLEISGCGASLERSWKFTGFAK